MILFPAIDIRNGKCVRLLKGDYDQETIYSDDPLAQAKAFASEGASHLHIVDLDAAKSGLSTNLAMVGRICAEVDVFVQCGGGIRSVEQARALDEVGVDRLIIGTAALESPSLIEQIMAAQIPVAVGLDARSGKLATHGWVTDTDVSVLDMARHFTTAGVDAFIATDIARDGTLGGPDLLGLSQLLNSVETDVIASGGVGSIDDLVALAALRDGQDSRGLAGVIVGKALYEGSFDLRQGLQAVEGLGA
jgi:phosphoribosylformimino-5-aminoimidazole carboxamide ribotide isomerase